MTESYEQRRTCWRCFLYLSKAFDLVKHDMLVEKHAKIPYQRRYATQRRSYLTDRTQVVSVSGTLSSSSSLVVGVPQGSILGNSCPLYI